MKAGGAQFGSTSLTFFVRRILAPVAFGAQLCATGAVTADAGGHAQMTRPSKPMSEQTSAQMIARTVRSPLPPWPTRDPVPLGALGGIRTPDPQIRSLVLYPAELRAHRVVLAKSAGDSKWAEAAKAEAKVGHAEKFINADSHPGLHPRWHRALAVL
jgi:hypothetical protein